MSQANKDVLIEANAAVSRGDYEAFVEHCTDDTDWTFVGEQTLRGRAAVLDYMRATYARPPVNDVKTVIADGEHVVAIGEISIEAKDGTTTRSAYCDVWTLRGGKLAELKAYVVEMKPGDRV